MYKAFFLISVLIVLAMTLTAATRQPMLEIHSGAY